MTLFSGKGIVSHEFSGPQDFPRVDSPMGRGYDTGEIPERRTP